MNIFHGPITWEQFWSLKVLGWCIGIAILLVYAFAEAIHEYYQDIHVNDSEPEWKPGKTLGL